MLFHTGTFLVFFIIFLSLYLPLSRRDAGVAVLLIASNIFYGWWNWKFLGLLWITILLDFYLSNKLEETGNQLFRRLIIAASVTCSLLILVFFKYWNFFIDSGQWLLGSGQVSKWHLINLALPVGVSFYTFQSMAYIIDVYRKRHRPIKNLLHYAAFVSYFPQLVAGPIQRVGDLFPQIISPNPITAARIVSGLFLFTCGLYRKAVGDVLAQLHDPVFNDLPHQTPQAVLCAVFGFGMQIYLDFAGYTDMARGISRILGIDLLRNFEAPYLSASPREFWRRWHISLSTWLRDYLYISLGGNRNGFPRQLLNVMLTMLIGGLWHGAGWNFVIWGGLNGFYLCANSVWNRLGFIKFPKPFSGIFPRILFLIAGWSFTFLAVNYSWIYFRCSTLKEALIVNQKLWAWLSHPSLPSAKPVILLLIPILVMDILIRIHGEIFAVGTILTTRRAVTYGLATGVLFLIGFVLLVGQPTTQFIYFQF